MSLRKQALAKGDALALVEHGDQLLSCALFVLENLHEKTKALALSRARRELLAAFEAYRHAFYGVPFPAGDSINRQVEALKKVRKSAKKSLTAPK